MNLFNNTSKKFNDRGPDAGALMRYGIEGVREHHLVNIILSAVGLGEVKAFKCPVKKMKETGQADRHKKTARRSLAVH